jgi:hypothetical protein
MLRLILLFMLIRGWLTLLRIRARSTCNEAGSLYMEVMMSVGLMAIVATYLMPLYPGMVRSASQTAVRSHLLSYADYVGSYIFRWANFSTLSKPLPLAAYTDDMELELSGETRINRLLWAEPLVSGDSAISDQYRASIRLWETNAVKRAVIRVVVWYDTNKNEALDLDEESVTFSTIVAEKLR